MFKMEYIGYDYILLYYMPISWPPPGHPIYIVLESVLVRDSAHLNIYGRA